MTRELQLILYYQGSIEQQISQTKGMGVKLCKTLLKASKNYSDKVLYTFC